MITLVVIIPSLQQGGLFPVLHHGLEPLPVQLPFLESLCCSETSDICASNDEWVQLGSLWISLLFFFSCLGLAMSMCITFSAVTFRHLKAQDAEVVESIFIQAGLRWWRLLMAPHMPDSCKWEIWEDIKKIIFSGDFKSMVNIFALKKP